MPRVHELSAVEHGDGPLRALALHETGATGDAWRPLGEALGERARLIAPDRRGWGASGAPEGYARTTVGEQAEDAAALIRERGIAPCLLIGAGLGAVAALDLGLRRPELASALILIEPPLLAFVPAATEAMSADAAALRDAVAEGGPPAGLELLLSGGLETLGAGAGRIPARVADGARGTPLSMFAELGAVSAWELPIAEMATMRRPSRIVTSASTAPLLREAADALAARLSGAERVELLGDGHPATDGAAELAELVGELG